MFPAGRRWAAGFGAAGAIVVAASCNRSEPAPTPTPTSDSPVVVTEKWRAKHEADYRREWVSIAGLFALKPGSNTAGSAKTNDIVLPPSSPAVLGRFVLANHQVRFEPAKDVPVQLKGQPVTSPIDLKDDSGA